MKRIYWFKILAMILCGYFTLPIQGWVLFIGLGHVLDVIYPQIKNINAKKLEYQKITEDLLYLLAYNCFRLGLDKKPAFTYIDVNNNVYNYESCKSLFYHYSDEFKKTESYNPAKIEEIIEFFEKSNDSLNVFRQIEGMVNHQIENVSIERINKLKEIASEFNISYSRQESYTYTENKTSKQSYSYNSKSESDNSSSYQKSNTANNNQNNSQQKEYGGFQYEEKPKEEPKPAISKQVKDAFAVFGFKPEDEVSLIELKRIYRKKAMKLHPDILKGQNVSDEKLKKAESELAEVNIAMDIVKKFLANN
tara:strand:- start:2239 stop:3159 length:921 start_codon:yes stop_codon:yes gene_type:complete